MLLAAVSAPAQHTLAAKFDLTKPLTLTGTVTQVDWANPYVHVLMKVAGQPLPALWAVEVEGPIILAQQRLERVRRSPPAKSSASRVSRPATAASRSPARSVVMTRTQPAGLRRHQRHAAAAAGGDRADAALARRPARGSVRRPARPATGAIRAAG